MNHGDGGKNIQSSMCKPSAFAGGKSHSCLDAPGFQFSKALLFLSEELLAIDGG